MRPPRAVGVVRALPGIGDLLCAIPALEALRAAWPGTHEVLVGVEAAAWLPRRRPDLVDDLVTVPWWPGIPEATGSAREVPGFLAHVHARHLDVALQLHGDGTHSNALTLLLGAATSGGHHPAGAVPPGPCFVPWPDRRHEVDLLLDALAPIGVRPTTDHAVLPVRTGDLAEARAALGPMARRPYAVLHPGATDQRRRWEPAHFAAVARRLGRAGLTVLVTGTAGERDAVAAVVSDAGPRAVDTAGWFTFDAFVGLLAGACVVVTGDTGPSHLAAAVGTPSVTVFTFTDPARWAPRGRGRHEVVVAHQVAAVEDDVARRAVSLVGEAA